MEDEPMAEADTTIPVHSRRTRDEYVSVAAMTSPWIEKYRPDSLNDLIAHQDIVETSKLKTFAV